MEGFFYPLTLVVIAVMAYTFFQNNNEKLALLMLVIGIYVVYSHETGYTATDFKNESVKSLGESADEWSKAHGAEGFDEEGAQKSLK